MSMSRQRGAAMTEFIIVGPVLTLLGLGILQYVMLFNAKNFINHAAFMAARAGSMGNADLGSIENAYARALVPLYGGGSNGQELSQSYSKANCDIEGSDPTCSAKRGRSLKIELLNPTQESFDDWSDPQLAQKYGARAIPNAQQAGKDAADIKNNSGQNIHDANLLKIKITHGYQPKIPLAGSFIQFIQRWNDDKKDNFLSSLYANGRIPIVTHTTMHMQSDPVEWGNNISNKGRGNDGNAVDPGFTESDRPPPPNCRQIGCTDITPPPPIDTCTGPNCPICSGTP